MGQVEIETIWEMVSNFLTGIAAILVVLYLIRVMVAIRSVRGR